MHNFKIFIYISVHCFNKQNLFAFAGKMNISNPLSCFSEWTKKWITVSIIIFHNFYVYIAAAVNI